MHNASMVAAVTWFPIPVPKLPARSRRAAAAVAHCKSNNSNIITAPATVATADNDANPIVHSSVKTEEFVMPKAVVVVVVLAAHFTAADQLSYHPTSLTRYIPSRPRMRASAWACGRGPFVTCRTRIAWMAVNATMVVRVECVITKMPRFRP
jgi:hypothetical protein